jgi:Tfp pilus assembly protein FimT
MQLRRMHGFSLLEMMAVVGIGMIASAITFTSLQPVLKQQRIANAYNLTMMALRQARETAVSQRMAYQVQFNAAKSTITISPVTALPGMLNSTYTLPQDVQFRVEPGVPNTLATTPDRFGTAARPVDFDVNVGTGGLTNVYFYPDGTAQDSVNNISNGVLYLARPGELTSSRAITVWGATGRIRGWRLYKQGAAGYAWQQQ